MLELRAATYACSQCSFMLRAPALAILRTPRGLGSLSNAGRSRTERDALLQSSMGHHAVLSWISTLMNWRFPTADCAAARQVVMQMHCRSQCSS